MSETIDPITWLKDCVLSQRKIVVNADKMIEFEGSSIRLPADTATAWKRRDGKGHYSLGSLCLLILNKSQSSGEYARESNKLNIPIINFIDKKDIVDYFSGTTSESSNIDVSLRAKTLIRKADIRAGKALRLQENMMKKREEKAEQKETSTGKPDDQDTSLKRARLDIKPERELTVAEQIIYNEKKIHSRATVLQCQKKNFLKVLLLGYQVVQMRDQAKLTEEKIKKRGPIASDVSLDVQVFKPKVQVNLLDEIIRRNKQSDFQGPSPRPIIIVPALLTPGNLSISNAHQFLERGFYTEDDKQTPANMVTSANGALIAEVKRKIGDQEVTFEVYDSVQNFTETRWNRVVAVFVNGHDWQFRDWKCSNKKRELFARVRAYHMQFIGQKVPVTISQWNVKKLELPRYKRHQDINVQTAFWQDFEAFLKREKYTGADF